MLFANVSFIFSQEKQTDVFFQKGKKYTIADIAVTGVVKFSKQSVKIYSGLREGQYINIPGDKTSSAIKKLYETKRFSQVDLYVTKVEGEKIYLKFEVIEFPQLSDFNIVGIKKSWSKDLIKETKLKRGVIVTDNLLITTKNYFVKKLREKGYLKTKVNIATQKDTINFQNAVNMTIVVDKGPRVKIRKINFIGNKKLSDTKLRGYLKETKQKSFWRFWKSSKFIKEKFEEDLEKLIEKYRELGFRDARVINHSVTENAEGQTINLDIQIKEGKKYYFREIKFLGNSRFKTQELQRFLKIKKGDIYNDKILNERIKGDGKPDSEDISSIYQNNGYLFSQVNAVETRVDKDSITVEIRIREDKPAIIRHVEVKGNEVTNDHVIYRELRTRPGQLYSKQDIIRTIREISQLRFFDPQSITPDLKPDYMGKTVDITYNVAKKGNSQIELQGGYGGGSFIGTIGLSFNNFSIRNLFNLKEYKPLPVGDAQTLALRLQISRFYSTYSFSFSEPWLGGKAPKNFSFSVYHSTQYRYNYQLRDVDKSQYIKIIGLSVSLGERLKWPDDFFVLSQGLNYQQYDINKYQLGVLNFENGTGSSYNISYTIAISRNSAGPNPIFPTVGSNFSLSTKFTFPYSLVSGRDFSNLEQKREYQYVDKNGNLNINPQTNKPYVRYGRINQEKFRWLEYYKINVKSSWFTSLIGQLVLMTRADMGYLGYYNKDLKDIPFEKYYVGGDGLQQTQFDGREVIGLRGYGNSRLSSTRGGRIYNKFTAEFRYPVTLKPMASIYVLGFLEGGNSYDNFEDFNPFDIKKSAGIGVRIFMPAFGMLGIDFGHGFDPHPGQTEKSGWQTHFVIGQQF